MINENFQLDASKAKLEDSVLTVTIPKAVKANTPLKIEIE